MTAQQDRALRDLYESGVISKETFDEASKKVPEREESDIYVNNQGMLCIKYIYGINQWTIRIPLAYDFTTYLRENYPMTTSKQGRKNKALWKFVAKNRDVLRKLDAERKQKYLSQDVKEGVKSEPKGKSRVISVAQSGGW